MYGLAHTGVSMLVYGVAGVVALVSGAVAVVKAKRSGRNGGES